MTWGSNKKISFKRSHEERKENRLTLDSEIDFPEFQGLDKLSSSSSNPSILQYDHIQDPTKQVNKTDEECKKNGWLYLSVDPNTNRVKWDDYSYGTCNREEIEAQEKAEAFLTQWAEDFEIEKQNFRAEYGEDAYRNQYYDYEVPEDDNLSDGGDEFVYDDLGEYSDEDYV